MKKKKLFLVFLIIPALCMAQIETDPERAIQFDANPKYRSFVGGMGGVYLKNTYMSPLTHTGITSNIGYNQTQYYKKGVSDLFFDFVTDAAGKESNMMNLRLEIGYFYHRLVYSRENLLLYAGLGGSLGGGVTLNVNGFGYNAAAITANLSALPSVMVKYRLRLFNQNFDLSQQIYTPLIGYGTYPRYSGLITNYGAFSASSKGIPFFFTSLHNYRGFSGRTYIDWRVKNKAGMEKNVFWRFGYQYEGSRANIDNNSYQISRGIFFVGTVRKF
jgi:hypothetical protein